MGWTFRAPPGWPAPPPGWVSPVGWTPDPALAPAPPDWQFWAWEQPAPKARLTRAAKRTGLGILTASILLLIISTFFGLKRSWPALDATFFRSPTRTPAIFTRHLNTGRYAVFERGGSMSGVIGASTSIRTR